jgi:hypothetical protein
VIGLSAWLLAEPVASGLLGGAGGVLGLAACALLQRGLDRWTTRRRL